MTMPAEDIAVERLDTGPVLPIAWFLRHTDLRPIHTDRATTSDVWVASDDGDVLALALVEDGHLHRLGVLPDHRRDGIGERIVDALYDEYGPLDAECRESLAVNDFYEETGWTLHGVQPGNPEPLCRWRYNPD